MQKKKTPKNEKNKKKPQNKKQNPKKPKAKTENYDVEISSILTVYIHI